MPSTFITKNAHRGVDGKPVPSRFAERAEVEALFGAAGQAGKGVVLATPGKQCNYPDFYALQPRIGRPLTWRSRATRSSMRGSDSSSASV